MTSMMPISYFLCELDDFGDVILSSLHVINIYELELFMGHSNVYIAWQFHDGTLLW